MLLEGVVTFRYDERRCYIPMQVGSPVGPEASVYQDFFSIGELAKRWRCSRGTVYNRLRRTGAQVLDFAPSGKKGRKCVPIDVVLQIEKRQMRRLR
jgi:hypothetical protein